MDDLRPAFFCYPSIFSLTFLNLWVRVYRLPLSAIVLSTVAGFDKGQPLPFWKVAVRTITKSGWRYAWYEFSFTTVAELLVIISVPLRTLGILKQRLLSFAELAEATGATLLRTRDFSAARTLGLLDAQRASVGVSVFNNQIFRAPAIEFFRTAKGLVNFHPALLPDFRGSDPIVPALVREHSEIGMTLHEVNLGIDTGDILLQERIAVDRNDSAFTLNYKAWVLGAQMLARYFDSIRNDGSSDPIVPAGQSDLPVRFGYCSFPTRATVEELRRRGRRLGSLGELAKSAWRIG